MSDRLPSLTSLRAFEAAARHLSFAKAADELNVTPAALSFQIKNLEDHLGAQVFRRLNRAVELTEVGKSLAPGIADGFDALQSTWNAVVRKLNNTALTVTAGPAFTAKWLAPRLFKFAQAHPEIELRFSATLRIMDFVRDDIDVAIRFGQHIDEGLFSVPLAQEWMAPMVSPEIAARLNKVKDLLDLPLIGQDDIRFLDPPINWKTFFEAAGIGNADFHGPSFSQADHAIDAALSGAGAVLGRISLTESYLRDGHLVVPFPVALWTNGAYRIVCPKGAETRPQVAQFVEWVLQEMDDLNILAQDLSFLNSRG